ncbi:hypothetical protein HU200_063055 [Digitaria exilis]|uniref:cytokinin dehydrogenase n=1 Tax=Digitaria exilis TaxID=1010633 RepID=A0A835A2C0_9POAL|nr:hypothetical protein HU200_063055 [Digitaria exilis]
MVATLARPGDDIFTAVDIVSAIHTDHDSITRASTDFGHIVEAIPNGVFHPTSPADIAALIWLSISQSKPFTVAPRGQGHSSSGQALASGGIVIDMRSMGRHDHGYRVNMSPNELWVDVGAEQLWIDYTPHLDRLPPHNALGGLGQFGVMTRARIALEHAPKRVLWVRIAYSDVESFTSDQELLISKRSSGSGFDYIEGQVQLNRTLTEGRRSSSFFSASELDQLAKLALRTGSSTIYYTEGAMYYNDDNASSVNQKLQRLLDELSFAPGFTFVRDVSYVEFLDRVGREEQKLRSAGVWDVPHPWLNLFVPRSRILDFDAGVFKGILKDTKPVGLILLYPMNKDRWDDRMTTATPDDDVFYAIGLLRSAVAAGDLERLERENAAVLDFCDQESVGCKQYLPHHASQDGWRRHFGEKWDRIAALKRKYDPLAILSPGKGIFPAAAMTGGDKADSDSL